MLNTTIEVLIYLNCIMYAVTAYRITLYIESKQQDTNDYLKEHEQHLKS